jgi:hypothetical protein
VTVAPTQSATPGPTLSADALRRWAQIRTDPVFQNGSVYEFSVAPDGLFASGFVADSKDRRVYGSVWLTRDGRKWERLTAKQNFDDSAVSQITRAGDRFLAHGSHCGYQSECSGLQFWQSSDGRRWTRLDTNLPDFAAIEIVAGGPGWIGVGADDELQDRLAAWTTTDGRTWRRATGIGGTTGRLLGVLSAGSQFVTYGHINLASGNPQPAVWTSPDGTSWRRVPAASAPRGMTIEAVARTIDGRLVGWVRTPNAVDIWTSDDGSSWKLESDASRTLTIGGRKNIFLSDLSSGPAGLVAFATADIGDTGQIGAWSSQDGVSWKAIESTRAFALPDAAVYDVAHHGTEILAVGRQICRGASCPIEAETVFWVSPPR